MNSEEQKVSEKILSTSTSGGRMHKLLTTRHNIAIVPTFGFIFFCFVFLLFGAPAIYFGIFEPPDDIVGRVVVPLVGIVFCYIGIVMPVWPFVALKRFSGDEKVFRVSPWSEKIPFSEIRSIQILLKASGEYGDSGFLPDSGQVEINRSHRRETVEFPLRGK